MKKMYCCDCDKDVIPLKKRVKEHYDFREKEFDVTLYLFYCPLCGGEIANEQELDFQLTKMWNAYLNAYNLSLDSFKSIRNDLGLSQDLFAKVLGWNRRSIIRYENKDEVPQGEYLATYVKLSNNKDYILECLNVNKNNLISKEYKNIINKIQLNLNIKARNAIRYILKDANLFIIQLIKNMFAADFLCYKDMGVSITGFNYIKMDYGPVMDNYKDIINIMQKTGEIKISDIEIVKGVERTKYTAVWDCDEDLFTKEELEILNKVKMKLNGKTSRALSDWSHEFKGWLDTSTGKIISYAKYAKYFNL